MADGFKINKAYAEKYNSWRQREELQKLKDKYGDDDSSNESESSSESEDENAEALTEQLEKDWLRTLAALKSKDPKIYQKDVKFYHDDDNEEPEKTKKIKEKPMYIKDYDRKVILEKGGIVDEEDSGSGEVPSTSIGYHHEQEQLRKSIISAAASDSDDPDDDDDDGLLKRREKTKEEKEKEESEYLEWLKGQKDTLEKDTEVGVELEPLKNYWQNKYLDEDEKFLKNYILNKQYIDNDDEIVPTYDEIVEDDDEDFSDDEETLVKQASFERKYNFRFEEPDAAEIKSFPRNFEESVRRKDTKRSEKRKDVQERKKMEKDKKKEELKQLKKLKRQEILDKIEKLKQITGNKSLAFDENELDEDFDPQKHDEMMQRCFDDNYYEEGEGEDVKPEFEMSDEEIDNWDSWAGGDNYGGEEEYKHNTWNEEAHFEDPNFIMDADYDPEAERERKQKKKQKKRNNKLAQALATKKPVFDPNEKTFEEYFDEYYKLDYEDIIDDTPCRFKYRKVTPNSFGLSVDEILKCRDKELNAWVSLKKMSQYRTEDEEMQDVRAFSAKGKNVKKKERVLTSLLESDEKEEETQESKDPHKESKSQRKRQRRKEKKKQMLNEMNQLESGKSNEVKSGKKSEVKSGKKNKIKDKKELEKQSGKGDRSEGTVDEYTTTKEQIDKEIKNLKTKVQISEDSMEEFATQDDLTDRETQRYLEKEMDSESGEIIPNVTGQIPESSNKAKSKKRKAESTIDLGSDSISNKRKHTMESSSETSDSGNESDDASVKPDFSEKIGELPESMKKEISRQVNEVEKHKKKKKKKKKNNEGQKLKMSDERLKAYGINPKRYKYMKKEELFEIKPRDKSKNQKKKAQHQQ